MAELERVVEYRFLTREEVIEILVALAAMRLEIMSARAALYKALAADDAEAHELPLATLVKRLELDCEVEYEQRCELEKKLEKLTGDK